MKNNDIVSMLEKDVKKQEKHLKYRNIYNIKNNFIKTLIRSGIILDYAFPYIISGMLISSVEEYCLNNSPFTIDTVLGRAEIETIDSSYGLHQENKTFDLEYNEKRIEYSTGWVQMPDGTYTRTSTTYKYNDEVEKYDINEILYLPEEELLNLLQIINTQVIVKDHLTQDDYIYSQNALFIINHYEMDDYALRNETSLENVIFSSASVLIVILLAIELNNLSKLFIKTPIRDRLNVIEPYFQTISKKDVERIKQIIALKKENIDMIKNENREINNFQLRK